MMSQFRPTRSATITLLLAFIVVGFVAEARAQYPDSSLLAGIADVTPGSRLIHFKPETNIPALQLFPSYGAAFGLGPNDVMAVQSSREDSLGFTHYRFRQMHNGIPVCGATYYVHERDGRCETANGFILPGICAANQPVLTEAEALESALGYMGAALYMWESPEAEAQLKLEMDDSLATYFPRGELFIQAPDGPFVPSQYRLTYRFDVYAADSERREYIYVDGTTGEIVNTESRIQNDADAVGTAETLYNGPQAVTTFSWGGNYYLLDGTRNVGTYSKDGGTSTDPTYSIYDDDGSPDNYWTTDSAAYNAHWAVEMTYDYFWTRHGRDSWDGVGGAIISWVHYCDPLSCPWSNAGWDGTRIKFGDGDGTYFTPLTALDVTAHEFTHGVTDSTADLVYQDESGALNESFSDIFGTLVEFYADPSTADWVIGEDCVVGGPIRSMSDPKLYGDPDTYLGEYYYIGTSDYGGVHTNSGVQNYWFYLLSEGGSGVNDNGYGYEVEGIGSAKAAKIAYRSLEHYLTETSTYQDARDWSVQAAIDLYGRCSPEHIATIEAWCAVGINAAVSRWHSETVTDTRNYCVEGRFILGPDLILEAAAHVIVKSMTSVRLRSGFEARNGCHFRASITDCCP